MTEYVFNTIGVVRSPFRQGESTPIQPTAGADIVGSVVVNEPLVPGLLDIDGFSHVFLIYAFHCIKEVRLRVKPYLDNEEHGVFATRAPCRPNPIGLSLVQLLRRDGNVLHIAGIDVLDGTPLLDIKPYIPQLNPVADVSIGWLTGRTEGFAAARTSAASEGTGYGAKR